MMNNLMCMILVALWRSVVFFCGLDVADFINLGKQAWALWWKEENPTSPRHGSIKNTP